MPASAEQQDAIALGLTCVTRGSTLHNMNFFEPTKRQAASARDAETRRQAHVAGYAENAKQWWDSGRRYYITQFLHGGTAAGMMTSTAVDAYDVSALLEAIENVGWVLDHVGYVYQPLTERSHLLTDSAHMTGNIIGIYTFKRPPARPDQ